MKPRRYSLLFLHFSLLAFLLLMNGCRPHEPQMVEMTFNATLEQPISDDSSKVYMQNERWIYWENGDMINIAGNTSGGMAKPAIGWLTNTGGEYGGERFNGVFVTTLEEQAEYFLGLFPVNDNNSIIPTGGSNFQITICLPDVQTIRTEGVDGMSAEIVGDHTFDKEIYPMVAWYGGDEHVPNMDFHALGSIVRLQIFNNTAESTAIKSVTITSNDNRQLKGKFAVASYKIENPYLEPIDNNTANQSVVLASDKNLEGSRTFNPGDLLTYYLVLPALGGRSVTTEYALNMTVTNVDNKTFTKNFSVKTRRTGMTNMRAMGIDNWETNTGTAGLAGCGTETRPFKVYNVADLQYLRDCYNGQDRTINGQPITANTWVAIMRTDIVLTNDNWTSGIDNFSGHMIDLAHQSHPGITSRSKKPLFKKISADGEVTGITLKCSSEMTEVIPSGYTPFCETNAGTIRNCALSPDPGITDSRIISTNAKMGGICRENNGTIVGCRNDARMEVQQGYHLAGICLNNYGTIKECFVSSEMKAYVANGAHVAGICLDNKVNGEIKDCYFATRITSTGQNDADWGGIVYDNSGRVEHCYFSSSAHIITTKSVGGIVMNNTGGTVDYCWIDGQLRGVNAGGIVNNLSAGKVINCFNSGNAMVTVTNSTSSGGGLVATMSGGSIQNSYVDDIVISSINNTGVIGGIVGTITGGTVDNCYALVIGDFFGGGTGGTFTHCYLVDEIQEVSGLTTISSTLATANTGTSGCLVDLLNSQVYDPTDENADPNDYITGAKRWQQSGNTPPVLEPYTQSSSKRPRRH